MKKILSLVTAILFLWAGTTGCDDHLNTNPSSSVGGGTVFSSADGALSVINGIYRGMYSDGWGIGWEHENGGLMAYILASDLMGEDHIQNKSSSGWFFYDYSYGISADYIYSYARQGQCWNFFYKLITNANLVLANERNIRDDPELAGYVMGQAYAIRAFCYLWLIQNYQQCDPSLPGVPVYTEPTTIHSKGKGRGTVGEVYRRINEDIRHAIEYLEASDVSQIHKSHIDKYVAYGIQARAFMVQKNYRDAFVSAREALKKPGARILPFAETSRINDVNKANVMWGLEIKSDQALNKAGIYTHIDADANTAYSNGSQFLISNWLYGQIPDTDARKAWWTAPLPQNEWVEKTSKKSYVQVKMVFKDAALRTGDYILMRMEEMALIAAEAACHLKEYADAREYVKKVVSLRDAEYEKNLKKYPDSNDYNTQTSSTVNNLMDYILLQRRIELWGEVSRIHDLQRLGLGVNRNIPGTNHTAVVNYPPKYKYFIYAIPQAEFDGNDSLDPVKDQNPL